ncbi:LA_0442/LA_0875 N-terminal domain-containing protein [Leptospira ilyithenensis]|uniref:DUF5683 domain-containing protein n=1 Tax=Leptospira ilyithenensis TaxID=2484901 RepID=A0A4R9LLP3_9LEPT|nr:hypothetical protein [Leptospira ilyithenensis]TGN07185.1 hypothetical protein EHS11_18965 [Leptospira ilyithenensis]
MKKLSILLLLILFIAIPTSVFAVNTVILKNGTNIKGLVSGQDDKGLTVKLANGNTQVIPKSQILKVIYKDLSEQEAQKIRLEEEKKLKAKEEAERKKAEAAEKLAKAEEEKRLAEEAKNAEALARQNEVKDKSLKEKQAKEDADRAKSDAEWLVYREKNKGPSDAVKACGSRMGIIWRSAVLPGWGQWCGGYKISAGVIAASFAGTIYYSQAVLKQDYLQSKQSYDNFVLLGQVAGPLTRLTPEFVFTTSDLTSIFIENIFYNNIIADEKKSSQAANARYLGSLGGIGLIYLSNLIHAYWIGREQYPERQSVSVNGKEIKEGFDFETKFDQPLGQFGWQPKPSAVHGELRYSILF